VGWIWVVVLVGSLVGCAPWADHRRYRGVPVPAELSRAGETNGGAFEPRPDGAP
jgi:hypothetical protein